MHLGRLKQHRLVEVKVLQWDHPKVAPLKRSVEAKALQWGQPAGPWLEQSKALHLGRLLQWEWVEAKAA